MTAYLIRRLLFMIPTLFGIMLVSFVVVQFAPGGPVEKVISQLTGRDTGATSRVSGSPSGDFSAGRQMPGGAIETLNSKYRGAQGLDPEFIKSLEKQFGFDKPAHERFFLMLWNYSRFDFGKSYFRDVSVLQLVKEKLPVSMSLGIWMTLLDLPDLDSARHSQGDPGRHALRHLDLGRGDRRLCDSRIPLRHPAHRAVRRGLLLGRLSAARA